MTKTSALDVLQVRALAVERFIQRKGVLMGDLFREVTAALMAVIDHE